MGRCTRLSRFWRRCLAACRQGRAQHYKSGKKLCSKKLQRRRMAGWQGSRFQTLEDHSVHSGALQQQAAKRNTRQRQAASLTRGRGTSAKCGCTAWQPARRASSTAGQEFCSSRLQKRQISWCWQCCLTAPGRGVQSSQSREFKHGKPEPADKTANQLLRTGLQCLALLLDSLQADTGPSCLSCCSVRAPAVSCQLIAAFRFLTPSPEALYCHSSSSEPTAFLQGPP